MLKNMKTLGVYYRDKQLEPARDRSTSVRLGSGVKKLFKMSSGNLSSMISRNWVGESLHTRMG